jgi:biopolymer transport protein ExbD
MAGLEPPPRRRIFFMLTPLVDVMFLLLIFFMLSSQTAPYSLLQILAGGSPARAPAQPAPQQAQPAAPQGKGDVVFSIGPGYVRVNGARIAMADLAAEIARLKSAGFSSAVVFSSPTATVQDVVSVLETFQDSEFASMRLVTQTGTAAP